MKKIYFLLLLGTMFASGARMVFADTATIPEIGSSPTYYVLNATDYCAGFTTLSMTVYAGSYNDTSVFLSQTNVSCELVTETSFSLSSIVGTTSPVWVSFNGGLGVFYWDVNQSVFFGTNTRFLSVEPHQGSTTASSLVSAQATFYYSDVEVYGHSVDPTHMNVCVSYETIGADPTIQTVFQAAKCAPVTSSGLQTISIGTSTLPFGYHLAYFYFESTDFPGGTWPGYTIATSTTFTVVAPSAMDLAFGSSTQALQNFLSGTATTSSACTFGGFDLGKCIAFMIFPDPLVLNYELNKLSSTFLTRYPWGYATRVYTILTTGASTTPPTLRITFPTGQGLPDGIQGQTVSFDPWSGFSTTSPLMTSTSYDGTTHFMDIFSPIWNTIVLILFGMGVFHEIIAFNRSKHHTVIHHKEKA